MFRRMAEGLKRTRVQVLFGFLAVMMIVLSVVGAVSYRLTAELVIKNTNAYLEETANQASARIDAVFAQIDAISMQLVMDGRVQQQLLAKKRGEALTVEQQLSLRPIVDNVGSLSWLINGIDLYSEDAPLYPLENRPLEELIGADGLKSVRERPGNLVWIGATTGEPDSLLAVRQVRLEDDYLSGGGYLVVKVANSITNFIQTEFSGIRGSIMLLFDRGGKLVSSTAPASAVAGLSEWAGTGGAQSGSNQTVYDGEPYLHIVKQSNESGWTFHMLVPLRTLTDELYLLRNLSLYALIPGVVVCVFLSWLLSERITLPIKKLKRQMGSVHVMLPEPNDETYFNLEMNELNKSYNKLVRDLRRMIDTVYEKERLKNKAEIKMLQAQIHPHFLFNTLESLYWKLAERNEREGAALVVALSKLFRYSIKSSEGGDRVPLSEEIEHCRRYLQIMKYRLEDRLEWDIRMDEGLGAASIPKLLIQPVVENAIQHGIERKIGRGSVVIEVREASYEGAAAMHIRVSDNGCGMEEKQLADLRRRLASSADAEGESENGIGLFNVQRRILMHYGDDYGLRVQSCPERGTEVSWYLPVGGDERA